MIQTNPKAPSELSTSQIVQFDMMCQRLGLTWEQGITRLIQNAIREYREDQEDRAR